MLTQGKVEKTTITTDDAPPGGNVFHALAGVINRADADRAAGLKQTRAARAANRARRDAKGGQR